MALLGSSIGALRGGAVTRRAAPFHGRQSHGALPHAIAESFEEDLSRLLKPLMPEREYKLLAQRLRAFAKGFRGQCTGADRPERVIARRLLGEAQAIAGELRDDTVSRLDRRQMQAEHAQIVTRAERLVDALKSLSPDHLPVLGSHAVAEIYPTIEQCTTLLRCMQEAKTRIDSYTAKRPSTMRRERAESMVRVLGPIFLDNGLSVSGRGSQFPEALCICGDAIGLHIDLRTWKNVVSHIRRHG